MLLEFWDSCDSHYKEIETDEIEVDNQTIEQIKIESYNQALKDIFVLAKQNAYDDGVDYSIGLHKLDELIANISK